MQGDATVLVLHSADAIAARVEALGRQICSDYAGKDLLVIGVLKGSFVFLADLVRSIDLPLSVDFVTIASYGESTESSGRVRVIKSLESAIGGRHVLVVEDIVDTGWTLRMSGLIESLHERGAASVKLCALLDKPVRRRVELGVDYVGFTVEDRFVVGYGLDLAGKYRNLPYVGYIPENPGTAS